MFEAGVLSDLAGPPATSPGSAILRLTLTASHDDIHLATALEAFEDVGRRLGVDGLPAVVMTGR